MNGRYDRHHEDGRGHGHSDPPPYYTNMSSATYGSARGMNSSGPLKYRGPLTTEQQRAKDMNFRNVDEEDSFLYSQSAPNPRQGPSYSWDDEDEGSSNRTKKPYDSPDTSSKEMSNSYGHDGRNRGQRNDFSESFPGGSKRSRSPDLSESRKKFHRAEEGQALDPNERKPDLEQLRQNRKESDELLFGDRQKPAAMTLPKNSVVFLPSNPDKPQFVPHSASSIPKISKIGKSAGPVAPVALPLRDEKELRTEQVSSEMRVEQLEKLHDKTQKKLAELNRTKRQRGVTDTDHDLIESHKLANDVKVRLDKERLKLADVNDELERIAKHRIAAASKADAQNECSSNSDLTTRGYSSVDFVEAPVEDAGDMDTGKFIYIDPNDHWCEKCDLFFFTISEYLSHMHSDDHWKNVDRKQEPWRGTVPPRPPVEDALVAPFVGAQFFVPIKGYFCMLCKQYVGSSSHGEDHLKSLKHNRNFSRFIIEKPAYERVYKGDRAKALLKFQKEEQRRVREEQEKEILERDEAKRIKEEEFRRKELEERRKEMDEKRRAEDGAKKLQKVRQKLDKDWLLGDRTREKGPSKQRIRERDRDRDRERDSSASRDSRSYSHSDRKDKMNKIMRDKKLSMKCEVFIPKHEMRRAYRKFISLSENNASSIVEPKEKIVDKDKAKEQPPREKKPSADELKIQAARYTINNPIVFDEESNDQFNLETVMDENTDTMDGTLTKSKAGGDEADDSVSEKQPDPSFLKVFSMLEDDSEKPTSSSKLDTDATNPEGNLNSSAVSETLNHDLSEGLLSKSHDEIITGKDVQLGAVEKMDVSSAGDAQSTLLPQLIGVDNFPELSFSDLNKSPVYPTNTTDDEQTESKTDN
ncbi:putative zinc finger protein [Halotydeus destructor]|nr:putative zinc finger protein [Halotydeus destructor]